MVKSKETPIKVFISYSHDTPSHKKWVGELATKLVQNNVDVILDQWDLNLGDDLPKFMEHAVTDSDRVLMICTELYVRKSDEGVGGVGYEAMIVTGEIIRNLGTSKFIPVIRQNDGKSLLPKPVSTRFYCNLSEDQKFDEEFETLLRELHQIPTLKKPPLGKNPFKHELRNDIATSKIKDIEIKDIDIAELYQLALDTARQQDLVAWRRIIRQAKAPITDKMNEWRTKKDSNPPSNDDELSGLVIDGANIYAPLISVALAGIESNKSKFNNQISILDDIFYPKNWNGSGRTVIVRIHEAIAFIYQSLHGALCFQTYQFDLAINLALTKYHLDTMSESLPIVHMHSVMGWVESLGRNASKSWLFLMSLYDEWSWLTEVFGSFEDYQQSTCGYYMMLNILDLSLKLSSGEDMSEIDNMRIDVPISFPLVGRDIARKAYRILLAEPDQIKSIWRNLKIDDSIIKEEWQKWIGKTENWYWKVYEGGRSGIPHKDLADDLL